MNLLTQLKRPVSSLFSASRIRLYAWLSLISQILIVVTGGLVRLTGSGLGCPTWPKCTDESITTVPEQGIHGIIEFGNRLLTFVLLVIALLTLISAVRARKLGHNRVVRPSVLLLVGIFVQAIVGGYTVLVQLNPWVVGSHFLISGLMIALATVLVWRMYDPMPVVPARAFATAPFVSVFGALTIIIGVLVTGAGPHAGDVKAARNGLDLEVWQHYHSYPAYIFLILLLVEIASFYRSKSLFSLPGKIVLATLAISLLQAAVGVVQARLGVPAGLVAIHMTLAAMLCSLVTFNHLAIRAR